jgi:phage major head subunit gpT-like protein
MHDRIIKEMKNRGWNISLIASRTGISQSRLEDGNLGVREQRKLQEIAYLEAHIDVDELEDRE